MSADLVVKVIAVTGPVLGLVAIAIGLFDRWYYKANGRYF